MNSVNNIKPSRQVCENHTNAKRDSSFELFRIITMFFIVAHHYVVNSGITGEISPSNVLSFNSLFSLLFGWGGKTGINCFILITGYFMCQSTISLKKFLKLLLELEFYKILMYFVFLLSGYSTFSVKELLRTLVPVYGIGTGFTSSYLVFFLFIPFLNTLINAMNKMQHIILIGLCLTVGTMVQTFLMAPAAYTYVGWFMVIYLIAAYIRLYPDKLFDSKKIWTRTTICLLIISWCSVLVGAWVYEKTGKAAYYFFVSDSNKLLAVLTAVSSFLYFKNLNMKYNSFINKIAASAFGVLLIHANSDTMRQWLWKDVLQNAEVFHSNILVFHAIGAVVVIYIICTLIDMIRIRFLEKPFFKWYDNVEIEKRFLNYCSRIWRKIDNEF